jgi:hypothetical protein
MGTLGNLKLRAEAAIADYKRKVAEQAAFEAKRKSAANAAYKAEFEVASIQESESAARSKARGEARSKFNAPRPAQSPGMGFGGGADFDVFGMSGSAPKKRREGFDDLGNPFGL